MAFAEQFSNNSLSRERTRVDERLRQFIHNIDEIKFVGVADDDLESVFDNYLNNIASSLLREIYKAKMSIRSLKPTKPTFPKVNNNDCDNDIKDDLKDDFKGNELMQVRQGDNNYNNNNNNEKWDDYYRKLRNYKTQMKNYRLLLKTSMIVFTKVQEWLINKFMPQINTLISNIWRQIQTNDDNSNESTNAANSDNNSENGYPFNDSEYQEENVYPHNFPQNHHSRFDDLNQQIINNNNNNTMVVVSGVNRINPANNMNAISAIDSNNNVRNVRNVRNARIVLPIASYNGNINNISGINNNTNTNTNTNTINNGVGNNNGGIRVDRSFLDNYSHSIHDYREASLAAMKKKYESQIQFLQNEMKKYKRQLLEMENSKIDLIKSTSLEIDSLRNIIAKFKYHK